MTVHKKQFTIKNNTNTKNMKLPYVDLKEKCIKTSEGKVALSKSSINAALMGKTFLVKGEKFNYRMKFIKSKSEPSRWTAEKRIGLVNVKHYLSTEECLSINDFDDIYVKYQNKMDEEGITPKPQGRPRLAPEFRKKRKYYPPKKNVLPDNISPIERKSGRPKSQKTIQKEWEKLNGLSRKRGRPRKEV